MGLMQSNRDLDSSVLLWGVLGLIFFIMACLFFIRPELITNELLHFVLGALFGGLAMAFGFFFRNGKTEIPPPTN